jgi:hypothetical protein
MEGADESQAVFAAAGAGIGCSPRGFGEAELKVDHDECGVHALIRPVAKLDNQWRERQ